MNTFFKATAIGAYALAGVLALGGAGLSMPTYAQSDAAEVSAIERSASKVTAHEVVSEVTDEVMSIVRASQAEEVSLQDASVAIEGILNQVVDFRYIVLGVMGSDAAKSASREQLQAFAKVFKEGLISTYSKGMTTFSDNTVTVLPPSGEAAAKGKAVTVYQEVKSETGTSIVSYSMAVNRSGEWVLRNVVLNGINLGKQFRSQFRSAMKQNDNDLNAVIAAWNA